MGESCAYLQELPVWFLADTEGSEPIVRHCTVDEGKHLCLPLYTNIMFTPPGLEKTCEEVKEQATFEEPLNRIVEITVNGQLLGPRALLSLASSKCFDLYGIVPREWDPPVDFPSATDGVWAMLKPLPRGEHHLTIAVFVDEGDTRKQTRDLTYILTVAP